MIKQCGIHDEKEILFYIGSDYPQCLYLYLDLKKYGFNSEMVQVFTQRREKTIESVLLRYYSCLHIYSKNADFDAEELAAFVQDGSFSMLYCTEAIARRVYEKMSDAQRERATITTGWVARIDQIDKEPDGMAVPAQQADFDQIVRLIYEDEDIGRSYQYDELARQLEERNREGYARNLVIKQGDTVIAHACTNAEIDNIAVVAELLVRLEFRRKGYASEIWRDICKSLLSEGKEVYSFYYSEESRALHRKIGFREMCNWSKIVIQ